MPKGHKWSIGERVSFERFSDGLFAFGVIHQIIPPRGFPGDDVRQYPVKPSRFRSFVVKEEKSRKLYWAPRLYPE